MPVASRLKVKTFPSFWATTSLDGLDYLNSFTLAASSAREALDLVPEQDTNSATIGFASSKVKTTPGRISTSEKVKNFGQRLILIIAANDPDQQVGLVRLIDHPIGHSTFLHLALAGLGAHHLPPVVTR